MSFMAPFPSSASVVSTLLDHQVASTAAANSHTFSGLNFGAGGVIVACIEVVANATFGTVTIGGVTATQLNTVTNANQTRCGIYLASGVSGPTGSIVVNISAATGLRWGVQVYSLVGQSSNTPSSAPTSTAAAPTATLNVPAGAVIIGGAVSITSTTTTWTNLTEDVDEHIGADTTVTSASVSAAPADAALTVTATFVSSTNATGMWAVWGP